MSVTQLSPLVHQHPQHGAYSPQQKLQLEAMHAPWTPGFISQEDRDMATALAHLASQHQASEYNRLKFGPKGAPFAYVPISIQYPHHVQELRVRQAQSALRTAWWLSARARLPRAHQYQLERAHQQQHEHENGKEQQNGNGNDDGKDERSAPSVHPPTSPSLQQELSLAMSSQLSLRSQTQSQSQTQPLLPKTSETHPINISMLVPIELLPLLSANLATVTNFYPTVFRIPPALHLDQLTFCGPLSQASRPPINTLAPLPPPPPLQARALIQTPNPTSTSTATSLSCSTDAALSYPPVPYPPVAPPPSVRPVDTNTTVMTTASVSVSRHQPTVLALDAAELANTLNEGLDMTTAAPTPAGEPHGACASPRDGHGASASAASSTSPQFPPVPVSKAASPSDALRLIGNLLLSSCPGKKVRLTGPVKGRGSICRDLRSDLSRVKDLGVGCIVCCLDDDELDFLGASWSEYAEIASSIGLDVLRIPTPEGLAPLAPRVIDEHLGRVISQYTLRGMPTLVHCRGGVGRAGLIACCWMLKLGLCGWSDAGGGESESIALVERAIRVVRRRRSVKAIETFEQVRFLVDFVDYLRERGAAR